MPRRAVINWVTAEAAILGMVLLAAMMPAQEDLLLPERRDWRGTLRRMVSPAARRLREIQGAREADAYVRALHQEPEPMIVRKDELPSLHRRFETKLLSEPTEEQKDHKPPWVTAPFAPAPGGPPVLSPRRAERKAPTIVMNAVRPAIASDLGRYLSEFPSYGD